MDKTATFSTDWPSGTAPLDRIATFSTGFVGGLRAVAKKPQVDGLSFWDLGRKALESVEKIAILSTGCPRDPRSVKKIAILSTGLLWPVGLACHGAGEDGGHVGPVLIWTACLISFTMRRRNP